MNELIIGKQKFNVEEQVLPQNDLNFYKQNPRVYSVLNIDGAEPTQDEILSIMIKMDHVKQLRLSIDANGGLIDPLIVRNEDYVVLEGNSRLAAYRMLAEKDPLKWKMVKCLVLPKSISDDAIFTLLGQYHLIGRKDWSVFEQAGYLYRKTTMSQTPIDVIAKDLGLKLSDANTYIRVYKFMVEYNDLRSDRWSYYDEYLKSQSIKNYRKTTPDIDEYFANQVKTGKIKQAVDIRNKLSVIARDSGKPAKKIMKNIIACKISLDDGFQEFEGSGRANDAFQTLKKFREKIERVDFQKKVKIGDVGAIKLELKKIEKAVSKLLKEFNEQ